MLLKKKDAYFEEYCVETSEFIYYPEQSSYYDYQIDFTYNNNGNISKAEVEMRNTNEGYVDSRSEILYTWEGENIKRIEINLYTYFDDADNNLSKLIYII